MPESPATFAARLHGREYPFELTDEEKRLAFDSRLVVVYGQSDDLIRFEGAIDEELGAPDEFCIFPDGSLHFCQVDEDDEEVLMNYGLLELVNQRMKDAHKIEALWCESPGEPAWTYAHTNIPNAATFDILEDGEVYCRGLVFALADAMRPARATEGGMYP